MRHKLYERFGRFVIQKEDIDALPDWLQQLMARVIVLRASFAFETDGNEYVALCPEFEVAAAHGFPPLYKAIIQDGRFLRFEPC